LRICENDRRFASLFLGIAATKTDRYSWLVHVVVFIYSSFFGFNSCIRMTKEKCLTCKKVKTGVKLRSTDNRMCEECFVKNENALKQLVSDNTQPGCSGGSLSSSGTGSALCQHCNVPANDTDSLLCDICGGPFHAKCAGITDDVFTVLAQILTVTGWVCMSCRASSQKAFCQLQSGQTQLAEEVAKLKMTVEELRVQLGAMTQSVPQPVPSNSSTAQLVKDSDRRRKTVVVSGLMPVHGVSDGTLFWDFCSNNLTLKPYVDEKRVGRVGKGAPQKLLVPLLSEHSAAEVLRCAKELTMTLKRCTLTQIFRRRTPRQRTKRSGSTVGKGITAGYR